MSAPTRTHPPRPKVCRPCKRDGIALARCGECGCFMCPHRTKGGSLEPTHGGVPLGLCTDCHDPED